MTDRYFVDAPLQEEQTRLTGPEAHHFQHVMRGAVGDEIVVFDGLGGECLARVDQVRRPEVVLTLLERRAIDRELAVAITLGVALPKGDRQRWLVEKIVELGATRLVPLHTRRSAGQGNDDAAPRLRRAAIEAAKQCGGNRLLEIAPRTEWDAWLASAPASAARYVAHPSGDSQGAAPGLAEAAMAGEVWFAVGPEGGFTDNEITAALEAGWRSISLGPRILRIETAAIALTALAAAASMRVRDC